MTCHRNQRTKAKVHIQTAYLAIQLGELPNNHFYAIQCKQQDDTVVLWEPSTCIKLEGVHHPSILWVHTLKLNRQSTGAWMLDKLIAIAYAARASALLAPCLLFEYVLPEGTGICLDRSVQLTMSEWHPARTSSKLQRPVKNNTCQGALAPSDFGMWQCSKFSDGVHIR